MNSNNGQQVDDALHLLQDAAEKFAAAGKQAAADKVYALVEELAREGQP